MKKLEADIAQLNAEKVASTVREDEVTVFIRRIESLKTELEEEKGQGVELRKQLETTQKAEQEKTKLQREILEKNKKITDAETKLKEAEEKLKKSERSTVLNKGKVTKLEKELGEEKEKVRVNESTQKEVAAGWLKDRDALKGQVTELQDKADELETTLAKKDLVIQQLEVTVNEERERATDASVNAGSAEKREIGVLREELASHKTQLLELTHKLEKAEKNQKSLEEKSKKTELDTKKEKQTLENKASDLEIDLQAEKKKSERMKVTQDKELKNREQELCSLKSKIRSLESNTGASNKKIAEVKEELQAKIDKLEEDLLSERQEYEDLTTKYEILEEEHVVTKAQLVMDKEIIQNQLLASKRDIVNAETELTKLKDTYNHKQDGWIKEKLDQEERVKELEQKVARSNGSDGWNNEKARLKSIMDGQTSEMEMIRREAEVIADQMNHMRKENEDLRHKLDDFDKVVKIQRNMTADTTAIDKELRETKNKLYQEEKNHKSEVAQMKLRYDSRVILIGEEIQALQSQVSRFKRERDTFRHMLEGAQKTIGDLKASPRNPSQDGKSSGPSEDEAEETRTKIASLEQQISCMEDELSEARLEASKFKTELISERSAWDVKQSETQSRINELEEDRIISSGRTKIPGMRTRMELAWHREREEQHRLLQETSTLARDLRQTLFEVERERDKERLEAKRRHDLLKKTTEEEQDENRKKVTELQCDLLELRDAHAKLRTTNEKLRREKERNEKEREELRQTVSGKKRADQDEDRKINMLLQQVDELMRLAPDLFPAQEKTASVPTPTPPRRLKGPKSRESSPGLERNERSMRESSVDRKVQLQSTVQRLSEVTEELKRFQRLGEEDREKDRAKRSLGFRRAASTESDNPPDSIFRAKANDSRLNSQKKGNLHRRSLSLEQTSAHQEQSIWKVDDDTDGSLNSLQSLESGPDTRYYQRRETSMDSRLSGGSTQSDVLPSGEKKKKTSIFGKLKKLTKSRSIDETNTTGGDFVMGSQSSTVGGSGSDISVGSEDKGSKKDLKDRFTGIFKKGGSRSNSLERSKKDQSPALPDSIQKPMTRNSSSSTLPRPSPARSDSSQTSSVSRPLVPTIRKTTSVTSSASSTSQRKTK